MKFLKLVLPLLFITLFVSCDDSDNNINTVKYVVTAEYDDEVFEIYSINGLHIYKKAKGKWEYTEQTDASTTGMTVYCENNDSIITITIYKNGKKIYEKEGNGLVKVPLVKLKQN